MPNRQRAAFLATVPTQHVAAVVRPAAAPSPAQPAARTSLRPGLDQDSSFRDVVRSGISLKEFRRHLTHFAPHWEHMRSAFNQMRAVDGNTGSLSSTWEACRRIYDPARLNQEPWNRMDCPTSHTPATDELLAIIGKGREDVKVVPIRAVGAKLGTNLRCFRNCAQLANAQPNHYVPVIGWMIWVSPSGGALAESHSVIRDLKTGKLQCITEPFLPETDTTIWFVPDSRTKPKATRIVNQRQAEVFTNYGRPMRVPDERDEDEKRPVGEEDDEDDEDESLLRVPDEQLAGVLAMLKREGIDYEYLGSVPAGGRRRS